MAVARHHRFPPNGAQEAPLPPRGASSYQTRNCAIRSNKEPDRIIQPPYLQKGREANLHGAAANAAIGFYAAWAGALEQLNTNCVSRYLTML